MPKVRMSTKQKQICNFIKGRVKRGEFQKDIAKEYGFKLGTFRNKCCNKKLKWTLEDEILILGGET